MTADELQQNLNVRRSRLYERGGIKELMQEKLVLNDVKVGGYYRPDCPPDPTVANIAD